jgi:hypothetical protein
MPLISMGRRQKSVDCDESQYPRDYVENIVEVSYIEIVRVSVQDIFFTFWPHFVVKMYPSEKS